MIRERKYNATQTQCFSINSPFDTYTHEHGRTKEPVLTLPHQWSTYAHIYSDSLSNIWRAVFHSLLGHCQKRWYIM